MVKNERIKTDLCKEDFFYELPQSQIAQHPAEPRDTSRLMVIDRKNGEIEHKHFYDVIDYLNPGDSLIINETRVIPARLIGERAGGGVCGRLAGLRLRLPGRPDRERPLARHRGRTRGV